MNYKIPLYAVTGNEVKTGFSKYSKFKRSLSDSNKNRNATHRSEDYNKNLF